MVLTKMNTQVDIINILGAIRVPTLLMQRTHDIDVKIEEGRFIAERIQGAKLVEFEGNDHLFWAGNTEEVLEEMKTFILTTEPQQKYEEQLFTIVAAQIIPSEAASSDPQELISQFVQQYRGNVVHYDRQTFIATFEGPSKAVHCTLDLQDVIQYLHVQLAIGIHIRECLITPSISCEIDEVAQAIFQYTKPNQTLVTQTVKHLLSGAGLSFTSCLTMMQTPSGESLSLFAVSDDSRGDTPTDSFPRMHLPQNDSLLENVLQSIDMHLSNESLGVDMLCREIGISERQLQRKLKAITNKSPNQLISSVRLHRAKELLLTQKYTIAKIASQTGFSSPSYFSKCFKKEFGLSPSDLLQQPR